MNLIQENIRIQTSLSRRSCNNLVYDAGPESHPASFSTVLDHREQDRADPAKQRFLHHDRRSF